MRICFALLYYDPEVVAEDPRDYLRNVRSAHDLPQAVAARGHEVSVVHLYPFDARLAHEGVEHLLVAPGVIAGSIGKLLTLRRRSATARFIPAWWPISRILQQNANVVHFLGTSLHLNLALLVARRGEGKDPAVVQAEDHIAAGLLGSKRNVVQLVETSSRFRPETRTAAPARTGMRGDPVFVWAARLHPLKDPMTALRGFARIAAARPKARLYVHYHEADLLEEARREVDNELLRDRVHFCGELAYEAMEAVFNSADFLLQASLREHSGCAVLDAMACGTLPVVTDIPSFRAMTGNGEAGLLFPPGDDAALARLVLDLSRDEITAQSAAVRSRFASHLSFTALASALERIRDEVTSGPADAPRDSLRYGAPT